MSRGSLYALPLALALLAGCGKTPPALPLSGRLDNTEAVIAEIREGFRGHAKSITVTFDYRGDIFDELNAAVEPWVEAAMAETGDPAEGDYLRCQYGGYVWDSAFTEEKGVWHYTLRIEPDYYDYLVQETEVTEAVEALLGDFGFGAETQEAQKLSVIYDYLCRNVRYDAVHQKNPYSHLKSTAYGALILRSATCQGYCAALYRLLRESGADCRIITGAAGGENHAWVIVGLNGLYYNLDPTWDAGAEEYTYFLSGSAAFGDHVPAERYRKKEFTARYPMAEESYQKEG